MRGNIAQMMQKAQRMQENMQKVQEELAQMEVTGQSGGGVVKITITGKMEARKVQLDPAALADAEMLEDLIVAALNDAVAKANDESSRRMAADERASPWHICMDSPRSAPNRGMKPSGTSTRNASAGSRSRTTHPRSLRARSLPRRMDGV